MTRALGIVGQFNLDNLLKTEPEKLHVYVNERIRRLTEDPGSRFVHFCLGTLFLMMTNIMT
jgi:hypothetical protein